MIRKIWRHFLALFRLSNDAICECSKGMGRYDYHDYRDAGAEYPPHFIVLKCDRCGKEFMV